MLKLSKTGIDSIAASLLENNENSETAEAAPLNEKMLLCNNIKAWGRANLPFPVRLKPQRWLYLANTFLAAAPRGVAALAPVSDDKTQTTLLIPGRGALSSFPRVTFLRLTHIHHKRGTAGKKGSAEMLVICPVWQDSPPTSWKLGTPTTKINMFFLISNFINWPNWLIVCVS